MFSVHVIQDLSAYIHGELSSAAQVRVESHLQRCRKCQDAYEEIRLGARFAASLSMSTAPDSLQLDSNRPLRTPARRRSVPRLAFAAAFAVVVMAGIFVLTRSHAPAGPSWEVTGLPGTSSLRPGQILQTDAKSEARVKIANIGQLTVDPNTQIRLLQTRASEHRIALDRGKVEATTWAPPRLFMVETPLTTAVDLGCKYTLEVEKDGSSLLHVTLGLVALERDGRETVVPAGAFCFTRPGMGAGSPFFEDASTAFQSALAKVDTLPDGPERRRELEVVLRESHLRDSLTLWHLLQRLDPESRGLIYDRLAQFLPPPTGVTREGIVALDPKMLDAWKQIVSQLWQ